MSAKAKQWVFHLILASAAAAVTSLARAAENGMLTQHDLLVALQTALAYLGGAALKSPGDAREPDAQTRDGDR